MIRKSGNRFSEKIMLKQRDEIIDQKMETAFSEKVVLKQGMRHWEMKSGNGWLGHRGRPKSGA
jgi:hypothetical protein